MLLRLGAELLVHVRVREREHPAIRVPDHDGLLGPEQVVGEDERADRLVVHDPARVADHVRIALLETEEPCRIEARVHACDHGELPVRRHGQVAFGKAGGVALVGFGDLVDDGHGRPPWSMLYELK